MIVERRVMNNAINLTTGPSRLKCRMGSRSARLRRRAGVGVLMAEHATETKGLRVARYQPQVYGDCKRVLVRVLGLLTHAVDKNNSEIYDLDRSRWHENMVRSCT